MATNKKKVVTYLRVTTQEQASKPFTFESQRENLRNYARRRNFEIVREFSDVGSASKLDRQGFQQMLEFLESSKDCSTILVIKPNRLCSDFTKFCELQQRYSLISTNCGDDKMLNQLEILLTQNFTKHHSLSIKEGLQKKKAREAGEKELLQTVASATEI